MMSHRTPEIRVHLAQTSDEESDSVDDNNGALPVKAPRAMRIGSDVDAPQTRQVRPKPDGLDSKDNQNGFDGRASARELAQVRYIVLFGNL